jgi:ankyrin repeat protein
MRYSWIVLILLTLFTTVLCFATDNSKINEDLRRAAQSGNTAEVRSLLDAGAEVNATDDDGFTALLLASTWGHPEVVHLLIKAGADVNAQDKDGATELMHASQAGHTEIVELLKRAGAKE